MASITIRNLSDDVKRGLRMRAAFRGTSMEEEARKILRDAVERQPVQAMAMAELLGHAADNDAVGP